MVVLQRAPHDLAAPAAALPEFYAPLRQLSSKSVLGVEQVGGRQTTSPAQRTASTVWRHLLRCAGDVALRPQLELRPVLGVDQVGGRMAQVVWRQHSGVRSPPTCPDAWRIRECCPLELVFGHGWGQAPRPTWPRSSFVRFQPF